MRVRRVTCANPSVHVGDGALVAANASVAVPRCVCPPTAVSTTTTSAVKAGKIIMRKLNIPEINGKVQFHVVLEVCVRLQ